MKTEENKSKEQEKMSHRFQRMGTSMGMCFGISIGLAFGNLLFEHGALGMCFGLPIGMLLGMVAGSAKDRKVNEQLAEKGCNIYNAPVRQLTVDFFNLNQLLIHCS